VETIKVTLASCSAAARALSIMVICKARSLSALIIILSRTSRAVWPDSINWCSLIAPDVGAYQNKNCDVV